MIKARSGTLPAPAPFVMSLLALAALCGCTRGKEDVEAPPRASDAPPDPSEASYIAAPIEVDAEVLRRAVEQAVPKTLWTIDQHFDRCVPPQRVKLLGARIKLAPKIGCNVIGAVTRGPVRLRGNGSEIVVELPLRAQISARDVGGVLKGETATGAAKAYAIVRLDVAPDWSPNATVRLRYSWTKPPGIDFLGKRIEFTRQADAKLGPIVRRLERSLPRELARLNLKPKVEQAWNSAFTVLPLNGDNPPVWMRLTPQQPIFGGYALQGRTIRVDLGLQALTETFVGKEPAAPAVSALPPPSRGEGDHALRFFIPVLADYAELEPVIARALAKRARRPFDLPAFGPVDAQFEEVTAYATGQGRIAVGLKIAATPRSGPLGATSGKVWLTALPVNRENSAEVKFTRLAVAGDIQRTGGGLLIALANSPSVIGELEQSLTQNFRGDLDKLVGKVSEAIAERREGDFLIRTELADVKTGKLGVYGAGLYLPVRATGTARIEFSPGR